MTLDNSIINIRCDNPTMLKFAQRCAKALGCEVNVENDKAVYSLEFSHQGVALHSKNNHHGQIFVDFTAGKNAHRRKFGGGKGQLISKACGIKNALRPNVLDATAGLGQDAFVLATLGCQVMLLERSPIVFELLYDGMARANKHANMEEDTVLQEIFQRMSLLNTDAIEYLNQAKHPSADVIYLDPMFPAKQKKAAVNKGMQAFHVLVGKDSDDAMLLTAALNKAEYRVVVKRPRLAPQIEGASPTYALEGKSSRYDIYVNKAFK